MAAVAMTRAQASAEVVKLLRAIADEIEQGREDVTHFEVSSPLGFGRLLVVQTCPVLPMKKVGG